MSEFRLYPCNPSLLRQFARIRAEQERKAQAEAIVQGLLSAFFAIGYGVLTVAFFWAATD